MIDNIMAITAEALQHLNLVPADVDIYVGIPEYVDHESLISS